MVQELNQSNQNKYVLHAYNLGYRVKRGKVYSPYRKAPLKLNTQNGYLRFSIRYNGKPVPIYVHKLVAYQKYGHHIFKLGIEIRHKDGNSLNNTKNNILIGPHSKNMMDIPEDKRYIKSIAAASRIRKFSDIEIKYIRRYYKNCKSYKRTMERFGISSKGSLYYIINTEYKTTME